MIPISEKEFYNIERLYESLHCAFPDREWDKDLIKWRNIKKRAINRPKGPEELEDNR